MTVAGFEITLNGGRGTQMSVQVTGEWFPESGVPGGGDGNEYTSAFKCGDASDGEGLDGDGV